MALEEVAVEAPIKIDQCTIPIIKTPIIMELMQRRDTIRPRISNTLPTGNSNSISKNYTTINLKVVIKLRLTGDNNNKI